MLNHQKNTMKTHKMWEDPTSWSKFQDRNHLAKGQLPWLISDLNLKCKYQWTLNRQVPISNSIWNRLEWIRFIRIIKAWALTGLSSCQDMSKKMENTAQTSQLLVYLKREDIWTAIALSLRNWMKDKKAHCLADFWQEKTWMVLLNWNLSYMA